MSGVVSPVTVPPLEIFIEKDSYSIGRWNFPRPDDKVLEMLTEDILDSFDHLRRTVIANKSIKLDAELCHKHLVTLAEWGQTAYQEFFGDEGPNKKLHGRLTPDIAPTFVSEATPFPWEVLYEGKDDDYEQGDPKKFWGLRYTPARILNPEKDITDYVLEQSAQSDMLFCLHHKLLCSHQEERPAIERLVRATHQDRFNVLGTACDFDYDDENPPVGNDLLKYFAKARHNMLHFACHCKKSRRGDDSLLVSFIHDESIEATAKVIELETYKFSRQGGKFICQPLVFLNACQSAGGADDLSRTFNLPKAFIKRGAAAVIATACPVPDSFAAAFAKVFYQFFLQGQSSTEEAGYTAAGIMTIGEALKATRHFFLEKFNNPLGLAYGLYSPSNYRIASVDRNSSRL